MRGKASLGCAILCGIAALALPGIAGADIGIPGPTYVAGTSGPPTTSKPESKLWFNDGIWWASMFHPGSDNYEIFRLDTGTQTWSVTGSQAIDTRNSTRQDIRWDGTHLWVASHKFDSTPVFDGTPDPQGGDDMRLSRFSYDTLTGTYTRDFTVDIEDDQRAESLVIDQAQDGKIWATWVQQTAAGGPYRVLYSRTNGDCSTAAQCVFTNRAPVPTSDPVSADDISSLIRFDANNIGIMWSDQIASAFRFVVVDPAGSFGAIANASSGPSLADDHINLKAFEGKVYAATKTKFDSKTQLNPQTRLLVRSAAGVWTAHTISFSPDQRTRPIVLLDTDNRVIHVFETGPHPSGPNPDIGGSIFESTSDMDTIDFAVLSRRPVIQDDSSAGMNNATSTKDNVTGTTDVPVLASNDLTRRYWHHFEDLQDLPPPPTNDCTISGTSGSNIITGTNGRDVICAGAGNDIVRGRGGNDVIRGGPGNDVLVGGTGSDRLVGQAGRDRLLGAA
ncbi:MAG: calcium-binding protein, partial [Gaiellaceae bacterium]